MAISVASLPFLDPDTKEYNVIIETPKGNRNKFTYDETLQLYRLKKVLPAGASFPYDFGFLPSTLGGDNDPLDVLVLMEEPAFPGCLVPCRLIGVIATNQTKAGHTVRNDRLLAVPSVSSTHQSIRDIKDLDKHLLEQIEHFFWSYLAIEGSQVEVIGRYGPKRAEKIVAEGGKTFQKKQNTSE
jgi:inorganic pyrophosphatase